MATIKDVTLSWLKADAKRPQQYKGQGRRRWNVKITTTDKAEAARWKTEFGMKVTLQENEATGKNEYSASLSRNAFKAQDGSDGTIDDLSSPNSPVNVLDLSGNPIDPNTVGNGSIGSVSLQLYVRPADKEIFRTLKTVVISTWRKRAAREDEDEFDFSGETKIIEEDGTTTTTTTTEKKPAKTRDGLEDELDGLF